MPDFNVFYSQQYISDTTKTKVLEFYNFLIHFLLLLQIV
jgi:hypothetical protein